MFGIGLPELAVIAFFGVVLLGPDKLPGLAKQLAHGIRAAKRMGDSVRDDLRSSLGDDYADLELRDLNPRELIRRQVEEALAERDEEDEVDDETVEEIVDEILTPASPDERKTA
ncbi:twin-arginine translocase TatA/TatE family subunit [Nocardioides cavernae]|jgi:sec-independent protein translocase protein TatB|uniref:Twin-arginine translocase TatA/TatE family subunit n=1 Tax=Nocardioides cavernae TaxID=1921566 RepID=A0ABR8NDR9_9ACTN|nr:twin-arginine translocase TatA/TatE family subunit [Nocardioides cavernae]MBD3926273.1 twin-arginine translocase TatA/TatE family subunit [Nocardioides cavernae]MBM7513866.1 sec-independent protein translocase protein TatB [Nocardioides cavernae]